MQVSLSPLPCIYIYSFCLAQMGGRYFVIEPSQSLPRKSSVHNHMHTTGHDPFHPPLIFPVCILYAHDARLPPRSGARGFTVLPPLLRQKSSLPFLPLVPSKCYPATGAGYPLSGESTRAAAPRGSSVDGDEPSGRAATHAAAVASGSKRRRRPTAVLPLKASDASTSGRGFGGGGDGEKGGDKQGDDKKAEAQVSAPKVSAPTVSAPKVSAPKVSVPAVSAPKVSAPAVSAPKVSAPAVSAPKVSAPPTPGATPTMSAPEVSKPQVSKPEVSKPVVSMPGVSGGAASKPPPPPPAATAAAAPAGESTAEASKDQKKGRLMSPLDMVVRPFMVLASGMQKEVCAYACVCFFVCPERRTVTG